MDIELPTDDQIAQGNLNKLASEIMTRNELAITKWKEDYNQAVINNALRAAAHPEPLPAQPLPVCYIENLNPSLAKIIFAVYAATDTFRAKNWKDGDPTLTPLVPDYSGAIVKELFVPPAEDPGPVNVYVSELVGPLIAGHPKGYRILGSKFYKTPKGTRAIGPDGKTYVLSDSMSPFNQTGEWAPE